MTPTEEAALGIVEKAICVFEAAADVTRDLTVRSCAERGTRCFSSGLTAEKMLERVWGVAHQVNVQLEILQRSGVMTPLQVSQTVQFRTQLDRCIREALYLLHPERFGFLADYLATDNGKAF